MSTTSESMTSIVSRLNYDRTGKRGAPALLLVHGFGSQKLMWAPVRDLLAESFDVVSVDLPGFGHSPEMPADLPVTARGFADVLQAFAASLGWTKWHVCGNSLGGWIALELAAMNAVESSTALAPAGLWRSTSPLNSRVPISLARLGATKASAVFPLMRFAPVRQLALGALFGKPGNVPADHAIQHARGFGECPGYARTKVELDTGRFIEGRGITCPLTVEFSPKDPLILKRQSDLSTLPPHTRFESPKGWGHVPTYDDPAGVVRLIRETAGV